MKKILQILMFTSISVVMYAQPVITNCENFTIGTVLTFQNCHTVGIGPGGAGPNQTWDFSTLSSLPDSSIEWMVAPSSTSQGSHFPTANLVEKYSDGTFVYVHADSSSSRLVGYADTVNNYLTTYADPILFAVRPISYGDVFTDTFSVAFSSPSYSYSGIGHAMIEADGYGTLILPTGSYSNVLRLKITQVQNDTASGVASTATTLSYVWFDGIHTSGLLKIDSSISGTFISKDVEYLLSESNPATGISEVIMPISLDIYPNPASGSCTIDMHTSTTEIFTVGLYEITGKKLADLFTDSALGNSSFTFPVSQYAKGLYMLKIGNDRGQQIAKKLIVE